MRTLITLSAMMLAAAGIAACGGGTTGSLIGGGGSSSSSSGGTADNVADVVVDGGPAAASPQTNVLYTTVTICVPGTSTCQTIDHIQVDTGSYGLRILSEVLQPSIASALPPYIEKATREALAECVPFADGYSWGPIVNADMQIAGEAASNIEIQVIGDPAYTGTNDANVPSTCSSQGATSENTVASFGANGILGVGPFVDDCGTTCTTVPQSGRYYVCATATTCANATVSEDQQVSNPVAFFATDNNGVIIQLPALSAAGSSSTVTGSLIFGIDTQSNNRMTAATVLYGDQNDGSFTTIYGPNSLPGSYIDSGSNGFFFDDPNIMTCPSSADFYCPPSTLALTATNEGADGVSHSVSFSIANAENLSGVAFNDIGGPFNPSTGPQSQQPTQLFDWGLPFFYGRSLYTAIGGASTATSVGQGPYFAY